jgi:hypothetical protein
MGIFLGLQTDPIFFCLPYYFFNVIDRATCSLGGSGSQPTLFFSADPIIFSTRLTARPYFLRVVAGCCQNGVCCHTNYWKKPWKKYLKKNYFRPTDPNFFGIWNRNHRYFFRPLNCCFVSSCLTHWPSCYLISLSHEGRNPPFLVDCLSSWKILYYRAIQTTWKASFKSCNLPLYKQLQY